MIQPGEIAFAGVSGLDQRMKLIAFWTQRSIMDPFAHEWTLETVRGCPTKDDACEINAVFRRLKETVRYAYHPRGLDRFQTLGATLRLRSGDCDNMTVALNTALHILGYAVGARIVSSDGTAWEHVYGLIGLPRNDPTYALPLDLTVGPDLTPASAVPGFELPLARMAAWRDFWFDFAPLKG